MIRVLLGTALPVLGVALAAAAFVGPSLVAPRGDPMLVASSGGAAMLQPADFHAVDCAALQLVSLTLGTGPEGMIFALREVLPDTPAPDGGLLLAVGPEGEIVGVSPAGAFGGAAAAMLSAGCPGAAEQPPAPGAI